MSSRTKTYIAGDWTGDQDLISQLYKWNERDDLKLSFDDAHELTQARDTSLACNIKRSLSERLDASKTFVLIVGKDTDKLTKGSCRYCGSYDAYHSNCHRGYYVDYRSFIRYECEKAKRDGIKIVVLYNYANVDRSKCPDVLRYEGEHIKAFYYKDGKAYWNYSEIRDALTK
ncbi:MAG: TIR domain-containing protein [Clostridiales bacterium]|nr:TIR domain-containing protein [Clostridiales bacterium]